MASQAYPIYAFHCLDAHLSSRKKLSLDAVDDLYDQYVAANPQLALPGNEAGYTDQDHGEDSEEDHPTVGRSSDRNETLLSPTPRSQSSSSPSDSSSSTPSSRSTTSVNIGASSSNTSRPASNMAGGLRGLAHKLGTARRRQQYPLFVTWNKVDKRGNKQLRGCIGTFDDQELDSGLRVYALTSALEDTRFSPISNLELPLLSASITLLMNFEVCSHPMDWELGTHGIRISFTWRRRRYGATYLPSVAVEQGWDKVETIVSLMRKAGWAGRRDDWEDDVQELKVVRYRGESIKTEWDDYLAWRTWLERQ